MSILKFKNSVVVPKSCIIAVAFINAANSLEMATEMLITSGNDGKHMQDSKHFTDEALDFRTHHLTSTEKFNLINAVKDRLGRDYDVILEDAGKDNEHLHIEYDQKEVG